MQLLSAFVAILAAGVSIAASVDVEARAIETQLESRGPSSGLPGGWKVVSACAADSGKQRVFIPGKANLSVQRNVLGNNTPATCASLCQKNGFGYAAVRMGVEVGTLIVPFD
jgi:hypothetical protein